MLGRKCQTYLKMGFAARNFEPDFPRGAEGQIFLPSLEKDSEVIKVAKYLSQLFPMMTAAATTSAAVALLLISCSGDAGDEIHPEKTVYSREYRFPVRDALNEAFTEPSSDLFLPEEFNFTKKPEKPCFGEVRVYLKNSKKECRSSSPEDIQPEDSSSHQNSSEKIKSVEDEDFEVGNLTESKLKAEKKNEDLKIDAAREKFKNQKVISYKGMPYQLVGEAEEGGVILKSLEKNLQFATGKKGWLEMAELDLESLDFRKVPHDRSNPPASQIVCKVWGKKWQAGCLVDRQGNIPLDTEIVDGREYLYASPDVISAIAADLKLNYLNKARGERVIKITNKYRPEFVKILRPAGFGERAVNAATNKYAEKKAAGDYKSAAEVIDFAEKKAEEQKQKNKNLPSEKPKKPVGGAEVLAFPAMVNLRRFFDKNGSASDLSDDELRVYHAGLKKIVKKISPKKSERRIWAERLTRALGTETQLLERLESLSGNCPAAKVLLEVIDGKFFHQKIILKNIKILIDFLGSEEGKGVRFGKKIVGMPSYSSAAA